MTKTYQGSCHCKAVRYQVELDLAAGTARCNCSYCRKVRNWTMIVKPDAFRVLTDEAALAGYQFGTKSGTHEFCARCGVRTFSRGSLDVLGGAYVAIMLSTLDDVEPAELGDARVTYANGADNDWWHEPAETRHL